MQARDLVLSEREGAERVVSPWEDALRVARFLRASRAFRARPDDLFISSYPRSGTTWMQAIVHLVRGGDASFEHIADVVPWYERPLAHGRVSVDQLARRASPRSFKSHLPYAWLPKGALYLYIYRDGRDVAVSYYHFYRSHLGYRGDFDGFFARFLRGDLQYGSWFRHVAHWERCRGRPGVLLLRYEEMRSDPERGLREIAGLCHVALTPARTQRILDLASFEAMRQAEGKYDHATSEGGRVEAAKQGAFVRSGEGGGHRALFSLAHEERFARARAARGRGRAPPPHPGVRKIGCAPDPPPRRGIER
jgi:hypothetical protein